VGENDSERQEVIPNVLLHVTPPMAGPGHERQVVPGNH
jgi:hypothetical protein